MNPVESSRLTCNRNRSITRKIFMLAAVLIACAGCTTPVRQLSPPAEKVPLPAYHVGTTFVYADGGWETVQAVGPQGITWRSHRGYVSKGSPDFTYRRSAWQTRTRSGVRTFSGRSDWRGNPTPASLWPLAPGKTARYIESGRWRDAEGKEHTYEAQWRSEVVGQTRLRVKAGEFDAWKIVSRRFSTGGAYTSARLWEIRTWYYAPAIGHYVKVERHYRGRRHDGTTELLAVIPPLSQMNPAARGMFHTNFQNALEKKPSGIALPWSDPDQGLFGATTPLASFKLPSGAYCRQYVQYLQRSDKQRSFYGLACRTDAGRWEIPSK